MLLRAALSQRAALSARVAAARTLPKLPGTLVQVRNGCGGPVGYGSGPYRGLKIPKVAEWHKNISTFYGTILWLWIFWRTKKDGAALLVKLRLRLAGWTRLGLAFDLL